MEKKRKEKKISLPSSPSLSVTGESNMNMNATCVGINVGK